MVLRYREMFFITLKSPSVHFFARNTPAEENTLFIKLSKFLNCESSQNGEGGFYSGIEYSNGRSRVYIVLVRSNLPHNYLKGLFLIGRQICNDHQC
jgi:hypothetical protein